METRVKEVLEQLELGELIAIHNEYKKNVNGWDDLIYCMGELDEVLDGYTPSEILYKMWCGDFKPCDEYFFFNGYANLKSANYAFEMPIYMSEIADFILENNEDFGIYEITEILEEA